MFSCTHSGRLCVCGHIKAEHDQVESTACKTCRTEGLVRGWGCAIWCLGFRDRAPNTAPVEEAIPEGQNLRGIEAKRIYV